MEDAASKAPRRPALLLRAARWLGSALVVLLLLGLGSYFAVPWLVQRQLEAVGSDKLGRQVRVASVAFKPWLLALTLDGLTVAASASSSALSSASPQGVPGGASGPQFSIRRITVDVSLESLWRLAPVVDAITVEAPQLRLAHGRDGGYDIDDILARLAAAPAEPAPDKPVRFALYNLLLSGGSVDFADETTARTHSLRELQVGVPFLSNLPSQRDVKVSPHLAFVLNGSRFDSAAVGTPFAQTRKTDATLKITGLDLKPYLAYWPEALPVKLRSAILDLDLRVGFEQAPESRVRLSGTADARQISVTTAAAKTGATAAATAPGTPGGIQGAQELLALDALKLTLADVRPLERVVKLASLALQAPRVHLQRAPDGRMVWPADAAGPAAGVASAAPAPQAAASRPGDAKGNSAKEEAKAAPGGWQVALEKLVLTDGSLSWDDASTRPVASLAMAGLRLDATGLAWPLVKPVLFQGSVALSGNRSAPGQLSVSGSASAQAVQLTATVADLPLTAAASYLAPVLVPALEGQLSADLAVSWKAGVQGDLDVMVNKLVLDKLALVQSGPSPAAKGRHAAQGRETLASVQQLVLTSAKLQLSKQELQLASVLVKNPKAAVVRGEDGRWMFEHWLPKPAVPASPGLSHPPKPTAHQPGPPTHSESPSPSPATRPWKLALADVTLDGGAFSFADKAAPQPVALEITSLNLRLKNLVPDGDKPQPISLSAKVAAGSLEPGLLSLQGSLTPQPLALQARLDAKHLPAHALAPYAASSLNLDLLRADTSYLGQLQFRQTPAGPVLVLKGDLGIEEFRANTTPLAGDAAADNLGMQLAEPLLNWKTLAVRGLDVALAPGAATRVAVRETVLSDFFARVIVRETGRINLQDLVRTAKTTPSGTPTAAVPVAAASARTAQAAPATPASSTASNSPAAIVQIGPISLLNGKVDFADHFVKPNYSADLSELTGKLSGFSSETSPRGPQLADLELRGRAESTASLEITGKLNPLAQPLALDIKGKVRDLELPPLSPYAIKYAGHGIERGKLSVDVAYLVKPDGQLTASNRLVLNQLSFGDRVASSSASLPVKLAVALLADRNGVIDLDLPISGSLNDPQFSLGPVIVKVILNVIGKALTAPFSLLAGALGGGGDELSSVSFAPGSARLEPQAKQGLDKVAKALTDRPSLQMTVVGTASLEAEREAFQRERLQALLRAEKRRVALQAGSPAGAPKDRKDASGDADPPLGEDQAAPVSEADYAVLLKQVYQRAEIPRPRNALGMLKDIPVPEMAALLLANLPATPEAMRQLALQRGVAVRDYLVARQLPATRLFLGAAKTVAPEDHWSPRAELSLATP